MDSILQTIKKEKNITLVEFKVVPEIFHKVRLILVVVGGCVKDKPMLNKFQIPALLATIPLTIIEYV